MDIKEKAKEYAEGKVLNALNEAIETAYAAGYKDGYDDGYANRERPQNEIKYNNIVYQNLDLPSGTKWATGYITNTDNSVALFNSTNSKAFNLPTKEQYLERLEYTDIYFVSNNNRNGTKFVSKRNGASIFLPKVKYENEVGHLVDFDNYVFWLKDKSERGNSQGVFGAEIMEFYKYRNMPIVLVSR